MDTHASCGFDQNFIDDIYGAMFRFANNQLHDEQNAKDVVQDALLNAFRYADRFEGRSAFKSWIFAILKNKITDFIRQNQKYTALSDLKGDAVGDDEVSDEALLSALFDECGHWQVCNAPAALSELSPDEQAQNQGFWQVLEYCLSHLPDEQARAFLMKEYIELETSEICQEMNITSQKFYVLMHRARLRLQTCLSAKWFDA